VPQRMKCPKCGYLGFETTDRCRNCQYDFSLTPFSSDPELTLHGTEHKRESLSDFELPPISRQGDVLGATALDLDRLFGEPEPAKIPPAAPQPPPVMRSAEPNGLDHARDDIDARIAPMAIDPAESVDEAALPFDDAPLRPPPAARTPLAVRRSTPEVPRNRPRTTRPVRTDSLNFELAASQSSEASTASQSVESLVKMPTLAVRVGAGLIDVALLAGIDAAVLYLTLRVSGLQNTFADLRVLPPVPFVGFLGVLAFGYVAAFTVAGGQTIGKMALGLRVISDDGRPIDAASGMLRALGCMLVPITVGLSYLPALFTSDHGALHDRLAGTRVVQE
ncbi:MAG: RDD family protein, partial [Vicinamibacterales bacterium]